MTKVQRDSVVAVCVRALPNEGCGLLVGTPQGVVHEVIPSDNVANSARLYEIDPLTMLRTSRRAELNEMEIIGVFHSHTHSDAYPSETDIRQAPDPAWHYVLVSLRVVPTVLRSYRVLDSTVDEEPIVLSA